MDGTAHAIMQLDIELGKHVGVEDACFRYVPDSSGFYNVPNDKLLDGLILGHVPGTVRAANGLHMATALFGTVTSFGGGGSHLRSQDPHIKILMNSQFPQIYFRDESED